MRKIKRLLLVIIASALVVSLTMILPAAAATSTNNNVKVLSQELVYCETDSSGEITGIQVTDWLGLNGDGTVDVREEKAFTEDSKFQGVRGFTTPSVEGDYIVWKGLSVDGESNVLASTKLSEDAVDEVKESKTRIPLEISYEYYLDGKKVDVEDITGQSGHFKMEVTFENTSREKMPVKVQNPDTGEMVLTEADTYLPLVIAPYDWYFDNTVFYNLEADDMAIVFPLPDSYQVAWSFALFPPATVDTHTIFVEADVKDFRMPNLTIPVAFVFPATNQTDMVSAFKGGFEDLYEGVKMIQDGIQESVIDEGLGTPGTPDTLLYGITAVDEGLKTMASPDKVPAMKEGVDNKLIPGMIKASNSAGTMADYMSQLLEGNKELYEGIGSDTTPKTLLYALNAITEGLTAISDSIGAPATADTLLFAAYALASNLPGIKQIIDGAITMTNSSSSLYALVSGTMPEPQRTQALGILSALVNGTAGPPAYPGLTYASGAIGSGTTPGTLAYAANAVYGGLDYIKNVAIGSTSTEDTLLYASDQSHLNLAEIKEGLRTRGLPVIEGVLDGLIELQNGLYSTNPNVENLKAGLDLISDGLQATIEGLGSAGTPDTLIYGSSAVAEGLGTMKEGLQNDVINGGTQVIVESLYQTLDYLNLSDAQVQAIKMRGDEFDHFLGRAESGGNVDADNMVRFVFQTKPTYDYKTGNSWITALILSIIIALVLVAGGILLAKRLMA